MGSGHAITRCCKHTDTVWAPMRDSEAAQQSARALLRLSSKRWHALQGQAEALNPDAAPITYSSEETTAGRG